MRKAIKAGLLRWILTAALLWVVWHHSHWSVALSMTLLAASNEMVTHIAIQADKKGSK